MREPKNCLIYLIVQSNCSGLHSYWLGQCHTRPGLGYTSVFIVKCFIQTVWIFARIIIQTIRILNLIFVSALLKIIRFFHVPDKPDLASNIQKNLPSWMNVCRETAITPSSFLVLLWNKHHFAPHVIPINLVYSRSCDYKIAAVF